MRKALQVQCVQKNCLVAVLSYNFLGLDEYMTKTDKAGSFSRPLTFITRENDERFRRSPSPDRSMSRRRSLHDDSSASSTAESSKDAERKLESIFFCCCYFLFLGPLMNFSIFIAVFRTSTQGFFSAVFNRKTLAEHFVSFNGLKIAQRTIVYERYSEKSLNILQSKRSPEGTSQSIRKLKVAVSLIFWTFACNMNFISFENMEYLNNISDTSQ